MDIACCEAWRSALHEETSNAVLGPCPHDRQVSNAAVRDPHFRAVQHIGVAIAACCGTHTRGVAAEIGFCQSEAANYLAARHTRQPVLLLLLRAKGVNGEHGERALYRHKRTQTAIASLKFLAGQAIANGAQPGAAVAFEMHAQQTKSGNLGYEVAWEGASLKVLADNRQYALADKLAHGIAHHALFFAQ